MASPNPLRAYGPPPDGRAGADRRRLRARPIRSACCWRWRSCCRARAIRSRSSSAPPPARWRRACWPPRRTTGGARWPGSERVWANFRSEPGVPRRPARTCCAPALHWVLALVSGGLVLSPPKSLLDNSPLRELLGVHVDCAGIRRSIARGHLHALRAVLDQLQQRASRSRSSTASTRSADWSRVQRIGRRTRADARSSDGERGDPAAVSADAHRRRVSSATAPCASCNPLSPAIHLGADRLLIIGVRARRAAGVRSAARSTTMPTPGRDLRLHARHPVHRPDLRRSGAARAHQSAGAQRARGGARRCGTSRR